MASTTSEISRYLQQKLQCLTGVIRIEDNGQHNLRLYDKIQRPTYFHLPIIQNRQIIRGNNGVLIYRSSLIKQALFSIIRLSPLPQMRTTLGGDGARGPGGNLQQ